MSERDWLVAVGAGALIVAASFALDPVMEGTAWRGGVLPAITVALTVAVAGRLLRAGTVATAVGSAAVWVVVTYITHLETSGLLPGTEQAREFAALWVGGMAELVREPAPVEAGPGLILILATVAWWLTHTVHEVLARSSRPGIAIVLAGLLWGVPLAVPQPATRTWPQVVPFLAAAGFVLLLHANTGIVRRRTAEARIPAAGVSLGLIAIVIATTMPAILPGYGQEGWINLRTSTSARGYQPIVDVTKRLKLPTPRDLLIVETERPVYLRLAGLDTFDGGTWKLGPGDDRTYTPQNVVPANRPLPFETEIRDRELLTVGVENIGLENVFVPAPYHPLRVDGPAASRMVFSQEGSFLATSDVTEGEPALIPGMTYTVDAALPTPSFESLRTITWDAYDEEVALWTALPREYPELEDLAATIRQEAGATTPVETAFALQAHFRDPNLYRYSTDVPALRGSDALTRFIVDDRVGYCEYFATAMAVMLRLEGIPARVAVGFRLGHELEPGSWLVTTDHAHAWVEVLFPGYGWIQFEPTPALPDALVPSSANVSPTAPVGTDAPDQFEPGGEADAPEDPAGPGGGERPELPDLGAPGESPTGIETGELPRTLVAVIALLAIAVVLAAVTGVAGSRRARPRPDLRGPERVLTAQRRVFLEAHGHGVARRQSETAQEVAVRWTSEGRVGGAAHRLAELAQSAAFGGPLSENAGAEAERLAETVVADLRASVPSRDRLVAPLKTTGGEALSYLSERLRSWVMRSASPSERAFIARQP
jgi:transglutaminase-like putative cysteine protease